MANIAAAQSGDFSATSTWTGGVVPGSSDVAYSNTFTVTISDTRTVQAISNASATGITVGGTFSLLNGCNLTCTNANGIVQGAVATSCVTTPSLGVGATATITASFQHTAASPATNTVAFSTSGTLNLNGNITGSSVGNNNYSVSIAGSGVCNITGNLVGGSSGVSSHAITVTGSCTVNVTGNLSGGTSLGSNALALQNGTATITGNVTGSSNSEAIFNNGSGVLTINGTCQSGAVKSAVAQGSNSQITRLSGPFLLGSSGNINPVQAATWRWAPTQIPTYMEVVASNGSIKRNLYTADNMPSGGYPTAANVRASTVYGPSSEFTGTLAIPAVDSVATGVAVDNKVGTAVLTAINVRTAVGLASANLDVQLAPLSGVPSGRLANVATVDTTGAQIQASISS